MSSSLNHWVLSAPSHTKFLRQYTKYSLADILVLRERKILQAFCGFGILESSAIFANSACKRLIVHKVQSSLACRLQVRNSRSNLLRILFSKVVNLRIGELRNLPDYKILQKHLNPESAEDSSESFL